MNYYSYADVRRFLEESSALLSPDCAIWVADNSNDVEEEKKLVGLCKEYRVNVVFSRLNLGYLGGAKIALDEHARVYGTPDYCVVSNADLKLEGARWGSLSEANGSVDLGSGNDVMMVAPDVRDARSGQSLNPFMMYRPGWVRMLMLAVVFSVPGLRGLYVRARSARDDKPANVTASHEGAAQWIYAGHGSLFVLARGFFARGGTLDWPGFLYGEELYIAEQIRALSGCVRFAPSLKAVHVGHGSTGGKKRSWQFSLQGRALRMLFKKYWIKD